MTSWILKIYCTSAILEFYCTLTFGYFLWNAMQQNISFTYICIWTIICGLRIFYNLFCYNCYIWHTYVKWCRNIERRHISCKKFVYYKDICANTTLTKNLCFCKFCLLVHCLDVFLVIISSIVNKSLFFGHVEFIFTPVFPILQSVFFLCN